MTQEQAEGVVRRAMAVRNPDKVLDPAVVRDTARFLIQAFANGWVRFDPERKGHIIADAEQCMAGINAILQERGGKHGQ